MHVFLGLLDDWLADWSPEPAGPSDPVSGLMRGLSQGVPLSESTKLTLVRTEFYWSYYRLFVLSFAVQQALDNPSTTLDLNTFCLLCYESARTMICKSLIEFCRKRNQKSLFLNCVFTGIARDALDPQGILRYATVRRTRGLGASPPDLIRSAHCTQDVTFVYLSYAAAFLRKLLASAAFKTLVDGQAVMRLMEDLISTMRRSAVDEYHTPALCELILFLSPYRIGD